MSNTSRSARAELFDKPRLGTVEQTIAPHQPGKVKFQGNHWTARFCQPDCQATVSPGELVTVMDAEDDTLLVVPGESHNREQGCSKVTPQTQEASKSSSQTTVKEVYRSTDLPDEYYYHFTEDEVEEFAPSCPITPSKIIHPNVVVPGEYCYQFTESEIEVDQALIECFNYLDEVIDF